MRFKIIFLALVAAIVLTSCGAPRRTHRSSRPGIHRVHSQGGSKWSNKKSSSKKSNKYNRN
ncbi:MAG: hypothetical protein SNH79_01990 [Rikenellaceae bacterium]